MVSIINWSKLSGVVGITDGDKSSVNHKGVATLKPVVQQGYFLVPTEDYLLEKGKLSLGDINASLNEIKMLKIVRKLKKLGDINQCLNLRICILCNNSLTNISGLANCKRLEKLDLHGNQLSNIPGGAFWSNMKDLKFLHLHNNPLGNIATVQKISVSQSLIVLTLYDTPLSLKRDYRHHIVNTIWSLKALDFQVISDEEVIEDVSFRGKFSMHSPNLKIKLCPSLPEEATYEDEVQLLRDIERTIINIIAHTSPVVIIQKWIRGHLARKRLQEHHIPWVTKYPYGGLASKSMPKTPRVSHNGSQTGTSDDANLLTSNSSQPCNSSFLASLYGDIPKRKELVIDLKKLEEDNITDKIQDDVDVTKIVATKMKQVSGKQPRKQKSAKKETKVKSERLVPIEIYGPILETSAPKKKTAQCELLPIEHFKLHGCKEMVYSTDALTEMVLLQCEVGHYIREAHADFHKKQLHKPPVYKAPHHRPMTRQEHLLGKIFGGEEMSCLFAVEKAYRNKDELQKMVDKMENVMNHRKGREKIKEKIYEYKNEKQKTILKQKEVDRKSNSEQQEKQQQERKEYLEKKQKTRNLSSLFKQENGSSKDFATNFSNHYASMSNALKQYEYHSHHQSIINEAIARVNFQKENEKKKKGILCNYLKKKELMQQTESKKMKKALNTQILKEANERIIEARVRVAQAKTRREIVQNVFPLQNVSIHSRPT